MANINVINGGEQAMKAMLFGVPDNNFIEYVNQGISKAYETLGQYGSAFMERAKEVYDTYNSSEAINKAKQWLYSMNTSAMQENIIYEVPYMGFDNTNQIMRDYIMVNPIVYDMNKDNMCYGFQDNYMDMESDFELKNKEKFRQVVDGTLQEDKEGSYIMHYSTEEELSMYDKFNILHTWDNAERMIAEGYDPTDPEQEEL